MDIIHVGLYGGKGILGGKETPLEASVISCDKHMDCSFFKSGQCLKVRSFGGAKCKFGSVSNHKGYTSKAIKYHDFRGKWRSHEQYDKLSHPPRKLGLIDNQIVFPYPFIRIEIQDSGEIKIGDPGFWDVTPFIPIELFTVELINKICSFRPRAMMGGEIESYRKETVPLFLSHLKELLPDLYTELVGKYEGYEQKINYVGRKAMLRTVNPSLVHYKAEPRYSQFNEDWYWDGEVLTYKGGHVSGFRVTKGYDIVEIKIRPHEDAKIVISSNDQVSENTVFID